MMTSSDRSFAITTDDATIRRIQINVKTDECIDRIRKFLFGQLPIGIIDDLTDLLASMMTRKIKTKTFHDALDDRDEDCPHCHALQVLTRMTRIFLDERVRSLNLDLFDELMKKEILKAGVHSFETKRVLKLSIDRLPVCIGQFNLGIEKMTSLKYLTLDFGISNETLDALGRFCPLLEHLEITFSFRINDFGLARLADGCKNLRTLLLTNALCITPEGFADALVALPKLEQLGKEVPLFSIIRTVRRKYPNKVLSLKQFENYGSVFGKDGSHLETVVQVCPNLSKLSLFVDCPDLSALSGLRNISSLHLMGVRRGPHHNNLIDLLSLVGKQITTLEIRKTSVLTISDLENIGQMCPRLETLILQQCETVSDVPKVRANDLGKFRSLNVLYFSPDSPDTSTAVNTALFLVMNARNVEEVYIEGCSQLGDEDLKRILDLGGFTLLRILQLTSIGYQSYAGLSLASMDALMDSCDRLEELGNMNKWNVDYKLFKSLKKQFKWNNLKLKLSNESLKEIFDAKFHS